MISQQRLYFSIRLISLLIFLSGISVSCLAANSTAIKLHYPELAHAFCKKKPSFWTAGNENSLKLRRQLIKLIESSPGKGLDQSRFHPDIVKDFDENKGGNVEVYFTDAFITYCKDLVKSPEISSWLSYDDISTKFIKKEEQEFIRLIFEMKDDQDMKDIVTSLEPNDRKYKTLINGFSEQLALDDRNENTIRKIRIAISYYRWVHHFKFERYIVVNIAAARLKYFEDGEAILNMKVVAGGNETKTPRFAAWCDQITIYPHWNVPRGIAINEILPFCQQNVADIDSLNMEVIDSKGHTVKPSSVTWQNYTRKNFPYRFRQLAGCDNPLGLIKFNLTDPFDIYMHDTNLKRAFNSKKRFYSHGCIRLEKPDALANMFLKDKLEENFLDNCPENPMPKTYRIASVPVFVIYIPAEVTDSKTITVYDDVYGLL